MHETAAHRLWTIVVVDQGGDQVQVKENENAHLAQLLQKGLKELFGEVVPNASDYILVIGGVDQTDLSKTLAAAGLHDHAEVMILPRDVSRGARGRRSSPCADRA